MLLLGETHYNENHEDQSLNEKENRWSKSVNYFQYSVQNEFIGP